MKFLNSNVTACEIVRTYRCHCAALAPRHSQERPKPTRGERRRHRVVSAVPSHHATRAENHRCPRAWIAHVPADVMGNGRRVETRQANRDLESAILRSRRKPGHATPRGCAPGTPPAPPAAPSVQVLEMYVPHAPRPRPERPGPRVRTARLSRRRRASPPKRSGTRRARLEHSLDASTACAARHRDPHTPETKRAGKATAYFSRVPVRRLERARARCGSRAPHDLSAGERRRGPDCMPGDRRRPRQVTRASPRGAFAAHPSDTARRCRGRHLRASPIPPRTNCVCHAGGTRPRPRPRGRRRRDPSGALEPHERLASFVSPPPPPPARTDASRVDGGSNESTTAPSPTAPAARSTPSGYLRRSRDRAAPRRLAPGDTGPTLRASGGVRAACALPRRGRRASRRRGRRPAARRSRPRRRRRRPADRARARRRLAETVRSLRRRTERTLAAIARAAASGSCASARSVDIAAPRPRARPAPPPATTRPRALPRRASEEHAADRDTRACVDHGRSARLAESHRKETEPLPSAEPLAFPERSSETTTRRRVFEQIGDTGATPRASPVFRRAADARGPADACGPETHTSTLSVTPATPARSRLGSARGRARADVRVFAAARWRRRARRARGAKCDPGTTLGASARAAPRRGRFFF